MPSYSILNQSGRQRLVRTTAKDTAVVTTFPTGEDAASSETIARKLAHALTEATSDIPHNVSCYVLDYFELWELSPYDCRESGTDVQWADMPARTKPFSLKRRALDVFDNGEARVTDPVTGISRNTLYSVVELHELMAGQPASVRRAVRDEIAAAYGPYDHAPVIARVYDYKYGECDELLIVNAALELLPRETLLQVWENMDGYGVGILDPLYENDLADFSYADSTSMSGYLSVEINRDQLRAWLTAHDIAVADL